MPPKKNLGGRPFSVTKPKMKPKKRKKIYNDRYLSKLRAELADCRKKQEDESKK